MGFLHEMVADVDASPEFLSSYIKDNNVDINDHDEHGVRVIEVAARVGSLEVVKFLLESKASVAVLKGSANLIAYAFQNPDREVLKRVCQPDVLSQYHDGTTELHAAAVLGDIKRVKEILDSHPECINAKTQDGATALDWAQAYAQTEVVTCITSHSAYSKHTDAETDDKKYIREFKLAMREVKSNKDKNAITIENTIAAYDQAFKTVSEKVAKKDNEYYFELAEACAYLREIYEESSDTENAIAELRKSIKYLNEVKESDPDIKQDKMRATGMAELNIAELYEEGEDVDSAIRWNILAFTAFKSMLISNKLTEYDAQLFNRITLKLIELNARQENIPSVLAYADELRKLQLRADIPNNPSKARGWGFDIVDVEAKGNCFFQAVENQIKVQKITEHQALTHLDLRQRSVNHVRNNLAHYGDFCLGESNDPKERARQYADDMAKPGTWATHVIAKALSREFNFTIFILQSGKAEPIVFKREKPSAVLYLFYDVAAQHYQALHQNPAVKPIHSTADFIASVVVDVMPKPSSDMKPEASSTTQMLKGMEVKAEDMAVQQQQKGKRKYDETVLPSEADQSLQQKSENVTLPPVEDHYSMTCASP